MLQYYFRQYGCLDLGKCIADLADLEDFLRSCGLDERISPGCADFLQLMLKVDPDARASAQQLLEHSYMCLETYSRRTRPSARSPGRCLALLLRIRMQQAQSYYSTKVCA